MQLECMSVLPIASVCVYGCICASMVGKCLQYREREGDGRVGVSMTVCKRKRERYSLCGRHNVISFIVCVSVLL